MFPYFPQKGAVTISATTPLSPFSAPSLDTPSGAVFLFFPVSFPRLEPIVECAGDDLVLLLFRECVEIDRVARYADRQLRVFLGMLLCVDERLSVEHVDVEMVSALLRISIE